MHSWTGSLLSAPLAADFGPCPNAAAEGRSAGQGVCLFVRFSLGRVFSDSRNVQKQATKSDTSGHCLLATNFGPGPEAAAEGCTAGREVCFLRSSPPSRRRLQAWPGGGGGGALSWTEGLFFLPLAANFGPGPEAAAEECAGGREVCFYASRRRLRAWPGGAAEGRPTKLGVCFSTSLGVATASARRHWRRGRT